MDRDDHSGRWWAGMVAILGMSILWMRYEGSSWDKIWRTHVGALVVIYALIVGVKVAGDVWLGLYNTLGPTVLALLFCAGLALWAVRLHRRHAGPSPSGPRP